eukprot:8803561-Prorocentrum_lima.AAC.1
MTSSLVGSEMCIRDSPYGMFPLAPYMLIHIVDTVASPSVEPWRRMEPVSYTHLTLPTICSV